MTTIGAPMFATFVTTGGTLAGTLATSRGIAAKFARTTVQSDVTCATSASTVHTTTQPRSERMSALRRQRSEPRTPSIAISSVIAAM